MKINIEERQGQAAGQADIVKIEIESPTAEKIGNAVITFLEKLTQFLEQR